MPDGPQKVAEARDWLKRAHSDLLSAAVLLRSDPSLPDAALLDCQQAVSARLPEAAHP